LEFENIFEMLFNNLKKLLYPEEWIAFDMEFSKSEIFTLLLISKYNEIIMSKIAENMNISMSTANGIVERLVKNDYLNRSRSESDRRIVVIQLSNKGKTFVNKLKGVVFDYIKAVNDVLDDEERKLIFKVFNKVMDVIATKESIVQEKSTDKQLKRIIIE